MITATIHPANTPSPRLGVRAAKLGARMTAAVMLTMLLLGAGAGAAEAGVPPGGSGPEGPVGGLMW